MTQTDGEFFNGLECQAPPNNLSMEQAVLGAMMIEQPACDIAIGELIDEDFYRDAHRVIFHTAAAIRAAGDPVDILSTLAGLEREGMAEQCGGFQYLIQCTESLPTAANIEFYCSEVAKLAERRRLLMAANAVKAIVQAGISDDIPGDCVRTMSNAVRSSCRGLRHMSLLSNEVMDSLEAASTGELAGAVCGVRELDELLGGFQKQDFILLAARPSVGKTAVALNIATNLAEASIPTAIFSLEMSRAQIGDRLIYGRAGVDLTRKRRGQLDHYDSAAVARSASALSTIPLYIEDKAAITIRQMELMLRKMKPKPRVVVVDYLQLMKSGEKHQNTFDEISSISNNLKRIAKDLDISLIALSQLSRQVESRDDKHPVMSDLRSCLATDNTMLYTSNGVQGNMDAPMLVHSLNMAGGVTLIESENVPKLSAETVLVTLMSGRYLQCTPNHLILTDRGWVRADKLTRDHAVATARKIENPGTQRVEHARWMGWMLGNGGMTENTSPSFVCSCDDVAKAFCDETERLFGFRPKPKHCKHHNAETYTFILTKDCVRTPQGNPVTQWLRAHGMWGHIHYQKFVPDWFMENADDWSIAQLLAGMIDTDGSAYYTPAPTVSFATSSRTMMWQYMHLMSRLGIYVRVDGGRLSNVAKHACYKSNVQDSRELKLLSETIPVMGRKGRVIESFEYNMHGSNTNDRLGSWVNDEIARLRKSVGLSHSGLGYRTQGKRISQADLGMVLTKLEAHDVDTSRLRPLVNPNIFWDRLKHVTPAGEAEIFDRHVPGTHNFIANGIVAHNSGQLEQDADVILFLFREAMYDATKPRSAIQPLDIEVAKHRNGACGRITVMWNPVTGLIVDDV